MRGSLWQTLPVAKLGKVPGRQRHSCDGNYSRSWDSVRWVSQINGQHYRRGLWGGQRNQVVQVGDGISFGDRVALVGVGTKKKRSTRTRRERVCVETRNDGLRSTATQDTLSGLGQKKCCAVYSNRIGCRR